MLLIEQLKTVEEYLDAQISFFKVETIKNDLVLIVYLVLIIDIDRYSL